MNKSPEKNYAFIDGQNLYLGTSTLKDSWQVDLFKFRSYLAKKYKVTKAYYFLGFVNEENNDLYANIQEAGFIITFRQHSANMLGKKKGNVDSDLIFQVMKKLYKQEDFDKVVLVSGDGDYKILVDFLVEEDKLKKILFPNQAKASSLYKRIHVGLKADLSSKGVRRKISYK